MIEKLNKALDSTIGSLGNSLREDVRHQEVSEYTNDLIWNVGELRLIKNLLNINNEIELGIEYKINLINSIKLFIERENFNALSNIAEKIKYIRENPNWFIEEFEEEISDLDFEGYEE